MRFHSGSIGSFTLRIISALAHTSSTEPAMVAPTARYASSAKPEPNPAPCSTSTVCPSPTSASAPAGTSATRYSAVLISFGTPTIIVRPRIGGASVGSEPDERLTLGSEELRGDLGRLVGRQRGDLGQCGVETPIRLAVHGEAGQTIHPCRRALQHERQLPLRLALGLVERLGRQPFAGELRVFPANRLQRLIRRPRLRADVGTEHAHLPVEVGVRVDGVGQPELLPNALKQPARHAA